MKTDIYQAWKQHMDEFCTRFGKTDMHACMIKYMDESLGIIYLNERKEHLESVMDKSVEKLDIKNLDVNAFPPIRLISMRQAEKEYRMKQKRKKK